MKVTSSPLSAHTAKSDLFVIPLDSVSISGRSRKANRSVLFSKLISHYGESLKEQFRRRKFSAKPGESIYIDTLDRTQCLGILFLGLPCPSGTGSDGMKFQQMGRRIFAAAGDRRFSSALIDTSALGGNADCALAAMIEGIYLASYDFDRYKSRTEDSEPLSGLKEVVLLGSNQPPRSLLDRLGAVHEGVRLARDLCNMPACDCTPSFFIKTAEKIARSSGLGIKVFGEKELRQMKAGGLLSVARGSGEPPALLRLHYKPKKRAKTVLGLVGKGVTFDSGGISIKPSAGMEDMKLDMAGAAAVLGAMKSIAALKPSVEIRAYMPLTENMVDGRSTKPGDIIVAMNGKSIEVVNTDAEGRLILADALCLAEKEGCDEIVDLATLTGAAVMALGVDCAALFTPHDDLAGDILQSAEKAREYLWRMPLIPEYREQMRGKSADLRNIGDKALGGGSITGALFLQEFIDKARWAHLDIAGPALRTSIGKDGGPGASGYGVRTILEFVNTRS